MAVFKAVKLAKRPVLKLHGKIDQKKRTKIINSFAEKGEEVLLTTDLAARGIDIPEVDWII